MLFGSPLRAEISRSGRASPEVRNADRSCDEWTTDLTRYGSRAAVFLALMDHLPGAMASIAVCGIERGLRNASRPRVCRKKRRFPGDGAGRGRPVAFYPAKLYTA